MTVLDYLSAWRRRWRIILACALIGAAVGFMLSPAQAESQGPVYKAELTMVPAETGPMDYANIYLAASVATSPDVQRLAAEELGEPGGTIGGVKAVAVLESMSVKLTSLDADPERAGKLVQAYATATSKFMGKTTAQSRLGEVSDAQAELSTMEIKVNALQDRLRRTPSDGVTQQQLAVELERYRAQYDRVNQLTSDQSALAYNLVGSPQISRSSGSGGLVAPKTREGRALAAGLLGLALGLVIGLSADRMDTRMRGRDDVEEAFELPVLAEIPCPDRRTRRERSLVMATCPEGIVAEGYRSLRSAVRFIGHISQAALNPRPGQGLIDEAPEVIVVAGPRGGDGKTTTAANLAVAFAEAGKSVVVIDCDFRNPQVQNFLGAAPSGSHKIVRPTQHAGVQLINASDACKDPGAMLGQLADLVDYARSCADIVLIDSGPLLVVSDAVDLLQHADAVLVTCRIGRTSAEQANRARMLLQRANVPLAGVVLLGTAGPGNRASLSEPAAWSRPAGLRFGGRPAAGPTADQAHVAGYEVVYQRPSPVPNAAAPSMPASPFAPSDGSEATGSPQTGPAADGAEPTWPVMPVMPVMPGRIAKPSPPMGIGPQRIEFDDVSDETGVGR